MCFVVGFGLSVLGMVVEVVIFLFVSGVFVFFSLFRCIRVIVWFLWLEVILFMLVFLVWSDVLVGGVFLLKVIVSECLWMVL